MIKSMTAFAMGQTQGEWGRASIEIKSVNHRYLDINMRLPDALRLLEMPLRELIRQHLRRGKVDFTLRYTVASTVDAQVIVNDELVDEIITAANKIEKKLRTKQPYNAMEVLRWPGVIQVGDSDVSTVHAEILQIMPKVLTELNVVREREGQVLANYILERIVAIEALIVQLLPRVDEVLCEQRLRLQQRITEFNVELDTQRLEQEIALVAQRVDIAEELDRLTTHVKEMQRVLTKGGTIGRRLDFLLQELNREANTIASKSIDTAMTQIAVELKVLIEQIREQVQNLE